MPTHALPVTEIPYLRCLHVKILAGHLALASTPQLNQHRVAKRNGPLAVDPETVIELRQ